MANLVICEYGVMNEGNPDVEIDLAGQTKHIHPRHRTDFFPCVTVGKRMGKASPKKNAVTDSGDRL